MTRLLDILLGRTRPEKSHLERLFAMSTAVVSLKVDAGLDATERAGICFRPLSSARFRKMKAELRDLTRIAANTSGTQVDFTQDDYGYTWTILRDPDFEDLIASLHMISLTLQEHGLGEQLLAAVFKFLEADRPVFWIYNYKRGVFHPLVPVGNERRRDNTAELRLRALLEKELPIEQDVGLWYPLWGIPF